MAAIERDRRARTRSRSSRTAARRTSRRPPDGRSAPSASPAPSASTRRRTSARSATAAPSSPTTRALADRVRRLRNGGQTDRYHHQELGVNSRLDEMQAAILRARLPYLSRLDRAAARAGARRTARRSPDAPVVVPAGARPRPCLPSLPVSSETVRTHEPRSSASFARRGIETLVHYPVPIPRQPAFADRPAGGLSARRRRVRAGRVAAAAPGARCEPTSPRSRTPLRGQQPN